MSYCKIKCFPNNSVFNWCQLLFLFDILNVFYSTGEYWYCLKPRAMSLKGNPLYLSSNLKKKKDVFEHSLDSKVHGANMGPTWVMSAPCWPHVGPMKLVISEVMDTGYSLVCEHFLWNCSQVTECNRVCTFDDKSTLVQVMAWCSQATSNYLSQCWARSILPYGITRSHWGRVMHICVSE